MCIVRSEMWSETSEIDKRTRRGASDEWKILYTTITLLNVAQKLILIESPDAAHKQHFVRQCLPPLNTEPRVHTHTQHKPATHTHTRNV